MKKIYLLISCFAIMHIAISQPTMNTLPKAGDEYSTTFAYTSGATAGAAGANKVWDYSGLIDSAGASTLKFVNASSTPYASDFPGATLAVNIGDTLFSYMTIQSGSPASMGVESASFLAQNNRPYVTIQYPFTYNSYYADSVTEFIRKPYNATYKMMDTTLVTGYGTLILPNKTYNNVLQVRQITAMSGTMEIPDLGTFPIPPSLDTSYTYYMNGEAGPLLNYSLEDGKIESIAYLKKSALPLHFISFTAVQNKDAIHLEWQTGDENNTKTFTIQRSLDGVSFTDIGQTAAMGSGYHQYEYDDRDAPSGSRIYYRIKETDKDGENTFSKIISCLNEALANVTIYPNPASDLIKISGIQQYATMKIYNLAGVLMDEFNVNGDRMNIQLRNFNPGIYIIQLNKGDKTTRLRFVKK